jgi:hypothetical protein
MDWWKLKPARSFMQNSLWNLDAHPELPDLAPRSHIALAAFDGPGAVRTIHLTLNIEGGDRLELQRGVHLQVRYDGREHPSIHAPVGDFFCDSFGGESASFSGAVMAKRPTNSLFCFAPMPFREHVAIRLVNATDKLVTGYGYVTAESWPGWEADSACLHANFKEHSVMLPQDIIPLVNTTGTGHFFGCHLAVVSPCPHFRENQGICEGNVEFFADGRAEPAAEYLGTEDFFGFSWNWRKLWFDDYSGTTHLADRNGVTELACYRFLLNDPVRFDKSLRARINFRNELKNEALNLALRDGNGDAEFRIVSYWYQREPVDAGAV